MEHMLYVKGISWIDDCRIPFVYNDEPKGGFGGARIGYGNEYEYDGECGKANSQGRFPANILVSDDMLNDGIISKSGSNRKNTKYSPSKSQMVYFGGGNKDSEPKDSGSSSRYYDIDKWFEKLLESCE